MHWIIDAGLSSETDLTAVCEAADWHRLTAIDSLMSRKTPHGTIAGCDTRADAEAFVDFAFADHAKVSDAPAEDYVDDRQYQRLSVR